METNPDPPFAVAAGPPRSAPLTLRVGPDELILLAKETNMLLDAVDSLAETIERQLERSSRPDDDLVSRAVIEELGELAALLESSATRFSDPPLELTPSQLRHVRQALSDLAGYHRTDLPPGLVDLRARLA